jgi:N12 class adenine-specific DNA methylase
LKARGIDRFDAWAGAFGETVTDLEPTAGGTYKPQTRFAQFVNVPELSVMVRQFMDVVTSAQLEQYVVRPKVSRELINVPMTPGQQAYQDLLRRRMEAIEARTGKPQKGDDIILTVIGDGRKSAIDMRLIDPAYAMSLSAAECRATKS